MYSRRFEPSGDPIWLILLCVVLYTLVFIALAVGSRADTLTPSVWYEGNRYVVWANIDIYGKQQKRCWPLHIPDDPAIGEDWIIQNWFLPTNIMNQTNESISRLQEILYWHKARYFE